MDTNRIEKPAGVSDAKDADGGRQTETGNLVDMGAVSVETKGILHGIELGFTPRSG